ncbi:MAG: hypothetical protein RL297_1526 [Pseudomonadota bacterium]
MKKTLFSAVVVVCVALPAWAQFVGPSASPKPSTAAQAKESLPGNQVTLNGNLVSHVRGEYYMFRDASGEMRVEVDNKLWQNRRVAPETRVQLVGEVDFDTSGRFVEVDSLAVVP